MKMSAVALLSFVFSVVSLALGGANLYLLSHQPVRVVTQYVTPSPTPVVIEESPVPVPSPVATVSAKKKLIPTAVPQDVTAQ
jgi:hypothetical protein